MAFNTNQFRQLYVAKAVGVSLSNIGDLVVAEQDGCVYFKYKGPGGIVRSDLIKAANITYANAIGYADWAYTPKKATIAFDSSVNSGAPVAGQTYIIGVNIRQFGGLSDEYTAYISGSEVATSGISASDMYIKLAINLAKSVSKSLDGLFEVYITHTSTTEVKIKPSDTLQSVKTAISSATVLNIVLKEIEPEWVLGIKPQEPLVFEVNTRPVTVSGVEVPWGTVTYANQAAAWANGKKAADLEYFCMGERADQYKYAGWPNYIPTTYLIDPTANYDAVNIHYYYEGDCEDSQKSERDITILLPYSDSTAAISTFAAKWNALTCIDGGPFEIVDPYDD